MPGYTGAALGNEVGARLHHYGQCIERNLPCRYTAWQLEEMDSAPWLENRPNAEPGFIESFQCQKLSMKPTGTPWHRDGGSSVISQPSGNTGSSVIVSAGPPEVGTLLSVLETKKPSHRPSGEKNGCVPSSVLSIGVESNVSIKRRNSRGRPSEPTAR